MANLGINPGTVAAALWIQQREQQRQAQLTRSLISLQAAEAAAEAREQAARDRAQAARDRLITDELRSVVRLQCLALGHANGWHDERGWPNARCATCETPLQHDACCTTPALVFAEGVSNESAGMHARAATCFTRALDLIAAAADAAPMVQPARVLYERAGALEKLDLEDDALADYTALIALDPSNPTALECRARLHERRGDVAEALEDYDAAAAVGGASEFENRRRRLALSVRAGLWHDALDDIERLALLEPRGKQSRAVLEGYVAKVIDTVLKSAADGRARGEFDAALRYCERIIASTQHFTGSPEVDAGRVRTFYLGARVLAAMGRPSEALEWLRAASQADPSLLVAARREPDFSTMANSSVGDAYRKLVGQSVIGRLFGSGR